MSPSDRRGEQSCIYRLTSIGRPLDPAYRSNLAVLLLVPAAGLFCGAFADLVSAGGETRLSAAAAGALTVFGSWALGRELVPDDNAAAFAAMGLAFPALFHPLADSVLLLFVALFLARIVNRSTGLAPRLHDSVLVTGLVIWAAYVLERPTVALAGTAAFAFDAALAGGRRGQWLAAAACLAAAVVLGAHSGAAFRPVPLAPVESVLSLLFVAGIALENRVVSVGDATGERLSASRVRAGMLTAWLLALASSLSGPTDPLLWASLTGAVSGRMISRAFKRLLQEF